MLYKVNEPTDIDRLADLLLLQQYDLIADAEKRELLALLGDIVFPQYQNG